MKGWISVKKRCIRLLSILLLVYIATSTLCAATENRASEYFATYRSWYTKGSGNTYYIDYTVVATGIMFRLGVETVDVYDVNDDDEPCASLSYADDTSLMEYNVSNVTGRVEFTGLPGRSYYAVVTFFAQDAYGSENKLYVTKIFTV